MNDKPVHASGDAAYAVKTPNYFAGVREDFLEKLTPGQGAHVLEIGCGFGETGHAALQRGLAERYLGCELESGAAAQARERLTEVYCGNVETLDLPIEPKSLDAVLMSEVLEHLLDPWQVVQRVSDWLKPGGLVMASSPNVSHQKIIRSLIAGRFDYADYGPMDRTHFRWFTPATYARMFEQAGLKTQSVDALDQPGPKTKFLRAVTLGLLPQHLFMKQIRYVGTKPG